MSTRDYFRKVLVGRRGSSYRGGGEPIFEYECRLCGARFPEHDRTGRVNEIGRNAHISSM